MAHLDAVGKREAPRLRMASSVKPAQPTEGLLEDDYTDFLRARSDRVFYLYRYRGNSGDGLIRLGTEHLLQHLQAEITADPKSADIIVSGGGNPSMWHSYVASWRDFANRHPRADLIVGPSTFRRAGVPWPQFFAQFSGRLLGVFARDSSSFDELRDAELPKGIHCGLAHDCALHLVHSDWLAEEMTGASDDHVLIAMRNDHERKMNPVARVALDFAGKAFGRALASRVGSVGGLLASMIRAKRIARSIHSKRPVVCEDVARANFDYFVDQVRCASEVHTDRLHTMLLALMLGKQVFAYETSYGKLEAVYEYSKAILPAGRLEIRYGR